MSHAVLPSFRAIRAAIVAAPPRPDAFPLGALRDPGSLDELRAAPQLQRCWAETRAEALRAAREPLPALTFDLFRRFEVTGDRSAFEAAYFDRRRRLLGLALASVVDATDVYLPALADLVWALCDEYSWALPAHLPVGLGRVRASPVPPPQEVDLFAAHTAHGLAELLALLGERLDPWLHYRVRAEVERRVFAPIFERAHHFGWEASASNWAGVCAGCAGMAALVLEDDRERLAGMIDRVVRAMESFLESFGGDGGCPEGIGYWDYGFGFYVYFAEMLERYTGGALNLLDHAPIQRIAEFPRAIGLDGGRYVNFSDAAEQAQVHPGLGSYLLARLGAPVPGLAAPSLHHDHAYRWGHALRDVLWTDPAALGRPAEQGAATLPELMWLVHKTRADGQMIAFAAKGGHNAEPHNHNDLGHFVLHLGGESLLCDLGAGVYTRQYFGPERYAAIQTSSEGHSVPLINGRPQVAGAAAATRVSEAPMITEERLRTSLDLTTAYPDSGLDLFVRTFDWQVEPAAGAATLTLVDTFEFAGVENTLDECFISLHQPEVGPGHVRWTGARGTVALEFDRQQLAPNLEQIETAAHLGEPVTVYRLRLAAAAARRAELHMVFRCHTVAEG